MAKAAGCYTEALAIYRGQPDTYPVDLANTLRGVGLLEEELGRAREARIAWLEAKDLYEAAGVEVGARESSRHARELE